MSTIDGGVGDLELADAYDQCFRKVTPRKNHTFSHYSRPCRYEPPLFPAGQKYQCPFQGSACLEIGKDLDQWFAAYTELIKVTLVEPSTSIVVRSEQQFHGMDRRRYAQRRHLYEVVNNGTPRDLSRFGTDCTQTWLHPEDRLGEYLGLIDLRLHFKQSPLALGLLVEPSHLREDPLSYILKGDYGPLFGAHSFRSTVFSMQDPGTAGAKCAQMCAIMALGMLSDRQSRIRGSFTMTYLNWLGRDAKTIEDSLADVDQCSEQQPIDAGFLVDGLNLLELEKVIRHCHAEAKVVVIPDEAMKVRTSVPDQVLRKSYERMMARLIESYLYARFPVILAVETCRWNTGRSLSDADPDDRNRYGREKHAVVVVGVRHLPNSREPHSFIIHDPGQGPFLERRLDDVYVAAREFSEQGRFCMIAATPVWVKRHADVCIHWLLRRYMDFQDYFLGNDDRDYQIRLLNRDSIYPVLLRQLFRPIQDTRRESPESEEFQKRLRKALPCDSRYWCISGYKGQSFQFLWIFKAYAEGDNPILFICVRDGRLQMSGGESKTPAERVDSEAAPIVRRTADRPKSTPRVPPKLFPAVLSSSSIRRYQDLSLELKGISRANRVDLLVPRDIDIAYYNEDGRNGESLLPAKGRMADLLGDEVQGERITRWIAEQVAELDLEIPSLATYFPDITNTDEVRRKAAVSALTRTGRLAFDLVRTGKMEHPIVELVCGTVLEPTQDSKNKTRIDVYGRRFKLEILLQSLRDVVKNLAGEKKQKIALALELEPGETYVLNSPDSLKWISEKLRNDPLLKDHVGINLDIAHVRIEGIPAAELDPYLDQIVHAHISDHPRIHTHDQMVGNWTNIERIYDGYQPYLHLLLRRSRQFASTRRTLLSRLAAWFGRSRRNSELPDLPFSNAVAIELEGCNRILSIHDSITRLRHAITIAQNRFFEQEGRESAAGTHPRFYRQI